MTGIGIDVSKGKSTVAFVNSYGEVLCKPFEIPHDMPAITSLANRIKEIDEETIILMEYTGHYHRPIVKGLMGCGLSVCVTNPLQMKKYGDTELRRGKTDKKDAVRIALYALEKSYSLQPYSKMEEKYEELRFLSRQYDQRINILVQAKEQLHCLLDETMPGITQLLSLKSRNPNNCVLLRFIKRYGSFAKIQSMPKNRFLESYATLVRKTTDRRSGAKGLAIYELAKKSICTREADSLTVMAQNQLVDLISVAQTAADEIMLRMQNISETIPEYAVLRGMNGVGERLGPIILAEI